MKWNFESLAEQHKHAFNELKGILKLSSEPDGLPVSVEYSPDGIFAEKTAAGAVLHIQNDTQFARALGLLAEGAFSDTPKAPVYRRLELQWDCSRNAVPHFDGFCKMIRHAALMGYTGVHLYIEDIYEMKKYPYFGHQRGRYTAGELRRMDEYAKIFSIDLVPSIQTLAHLMQPLQWKSFQNVRDCGDILLAGEDATYELIEEMVKTMAENLSSRRINIGMDEAHMLGLGKYLDKHGYQNRMDIMITHFNRVMEILRRYGYHPMMWSDMFYRLLNKGEYYADAAELTAEEKARIPDDISLVYWDYYSLEKEKYDRMIKSHKKMFHDVVFAGGAWNWVGFAPNNTFSLAAGALAHESCKENGISDVLLTTWGDDGAEGSTFTVLPTLQFWAESCYADNNSDDHVAARFAVCVGADYHDFLKLDLANFPPDNEKPGLCGGDPTRYLLYQDVMYGLCDWHVLPSYPAYYQDAAAQLAGCAQRNPGWEVYFRTQESLCALLADKCTLGIDLRAAYLADDREAIARYADERIPAVVAKLDRFVKEYRAQWLTDYKVFGLEVFDQRTGGLRARLFAAQDRLHQYLNGELARLEELETERLPYDCRDADAEGSRMMKFVFWKNVISTCIVAEG